jgi:starch synthase (maltosyl-transferring)
VISGVRPCVDDGRYAAKTVVGDALAVSADAFVDGHDLLRVEVCHRAVGERGWHHEPMAPVGNDRWRASFTPTETGRSEFYVQAGVDRYATWVRDLRARLTDGQDVAVEVLVGERLLRAAAEKSKGEERRRLERVADDLTAAAAPDVAAIEAPEIAALVARHDPGAVTRSEVYPVLVERERARFSTWYELFPRSAAAKRGQHGTLADVERTLDYVAEIGADVVYLPPIHPIGTTARKGRNGAAKARKGDVGSPWAIGSPDGGHTAVHPQLGTMADLASLVAAAEKRGIEIALDIAFQCSPDHPWVTEHPEWFAHRPDGTIRYAENPPKRYEDVYPLNFDTDDWRRLWQALRDVFEFWIASGITIFRVDNPHTKPFTFWEWVIPAIQADHDGIIFLAEAFTRPRIMERLAKLGFTQSYTYFAWRNQKWELEQYLTELTTTDVADYLRPNFWPNTPDILTEQLQRGNHEFFALRALLAGTLAASYGVYGPAFELCSRAPRFEGSEEYLNSEKYEIGKYNLADKRSLAPFLGRLNAIRREQLALQHDKTLQFHHLDNEQMMAYSKTAAGIAGATGGDDYEPAEAPVLVIANLDSAHPQSGWVDIDTDALGIVRGEPYAVHDLLTDAHYEWKGARNFVILDPAQTPAHIFRIEPTAVTPR